MDTLSGVIRAVEFVKSVNEDIDTLVLPFVSSSDSHKDSILRDVFAAHCRRDSEEFISCLSTSLTVFLVCCRGETRFKPVRGHYIHFPSKELLALFGSDFTYRCENVAVLRRLLLKRMSCNHIEATGHLVSVILIHVVIQRKIIACNASSYDSRMSCENSCNRGIG